MVTAATGTVVVAVVGELLEIGRTGGEGADIVGVYRSKEDCFVVWCCFIGMLRMVKCYPFFCFVVTNGRWE